MGFQRYNAQARLLLVKLYCLLGAAEAAWPHWKECGVKQVQLDSIGHIIVSAALHAGTLHIGKSSSHGSFFFYVLTCLQKLNVDVFLLAFQGRSRPNVEQLEDSTDSLRQITYLFQQHEQGNVRVYYKCLQAWLVWKDFRVYKIPAEDQAFVAGQ